MCVCVGCMTTFWQERPERRLTWLWTVWVSVCCPAGVQRSLCCRVCDTMQWEHEPMLADGWCSIGVAERERVCPRNGFTNYWHCFQFSRSRSINKGFRFKLQFVQKLYGHIIYLSFIWKTWQSNLTNKKIRFCCKCTQAFLQNLFATNSLSEQSCCLRRYII